MHPRLNGLGLRSLHLRTPFCCGTSGTQPTVFARLDAPEGLIVSTAPACCLSGGFGFHAILLQPFREDLSPPMQIRLSRIQSPSMPGLSSDADVHVRIGLMIV